MSLSHREKIKAVNPAVLCKVVESFSKALLFHEKRNKYVSKQVAILLRLLETNVVKNQVNSSNVTANTLISLNTNIGNSSTNNNTCASNFEGDNVTNEKSIYRDYSVIDMMLQQSSLANELRALFHGLIGGHSINLTVNGVLSLNVRLTEPTSIKNDIKCYQTLLTIADSDNLQRIIGALDVSTGVNPINKLLNISPLIQNMIKLCDPTMSFVDLSIALQEPLTEIISVAKQLQYWGLGRVVSTISKKIKYRIHPLAPTSNVSSAAKVFSSMFLKKLSPENEAPLNKKSIDVVSNDKYNVNNNFTYILSLFNGSLTVDEILSVIPTHIQPHLIDIIVWFLRWNFLIECKSHLVLDPYQCYNNSNVVYNDRDIYEMLHSNVKNMETSSDNYDENKVDIQITTNNTFSIKYSKLSLHELLNEENNNIDETTIDTSNSLVRTIVL